jgi:hypothetical protein
MNNVPEEAGKVATTAIDALKAQPVCLALLIGWLMTSGFSFFALQRERDRTHEESIAMIQKCFPPTGNHSTPPDRAD